MQNQQHDIAQGNNQESAELMDLIKKFTPRTIRHQKCEVLNLTKDLHVIVYEPRVCTCDYNITMGNDQRILTRGCIHFDNNASNPETKAEIVLDTKIQGIKTAIKHLKTQMEFYESQLTNPEYV